ncbi:MAG: DUF4202 domain-containing protein [Chloroflexi bacterium]|nr:DUF4202 domain-containing protein [Chloroflexota bacterium]
MGASIADPARFARAIAAIDTANAADPTTLTAGGKARPKELVHAEMMTAWVQRLRPDAPEPLLLAARAHHIRRWEVPRGSYPNDRRGYLRWRTGLHAFHAGRTAEILRAEGYGDDTIARVGQLIRKDNLGRDDDAQAMEDALCLVFLETQLIELAGRVDRARMVTVLQKTWKKMSPAGRDLALALTLPEAGRDLVREALDAAKS